MSDLTQSPDCLSHILFFWLQLLFADVEQGKAIFSQLRRFYVQFCYNSPFKQSPLLCSMIKDFGRKTTDELYSTVVELPDYIEPFSISSVSLFVRIPSDLLTESSDDCLVGHGVDVRFRNCTERFIKRIHEKMMLPKSYTLFFDIGPEWVHPEDGRINEFYLREVVTDTHVFHRDDRIKDHIIPSLEQLCMPSNELYHNIALLKMNGTIVEDKKNAPERDSDKIYMYI